MAFPLVHQSLLSPRWRSDRGHLSAELRVLSPGYADERVASTVVLIRDEGRAEVVDLHVRPGVTLIDRPEVVEPGPLVQRRVQRVVGVMMAEHHVTAIGHSQADQILHR